MKNDYPQIKLLPQELCNQIAAGEVVERPASVMKELVENSLDAKANQIIVHVENGGQSLIRVEDNGLGIAEDELNLALTRHATSKLYNLNDLVNINSYGFRGEALPSIASVSKFKISSKTPKAEQGSSLQVEFGKIQEIYPCSLQGGTIIEVQDLFLNIPARLKFLKSPATELKKLTELFIRLALVAENTNLSLYAGGRLAYAFQDGEDLKTRLSHIWPTSIIDALLPVNFKNQSIEIKGFVSNPKSHQPRADKMLFYVNGRAVNDKILLKSVRQAFEGKITTKDYPQCVLCLELDPQEIDVNVHPAKNEIRFRDEQLIFSSMYKAINQALEADPSFFSAKSLANTQTKDSSTELENALGQDLVYEPLYKPGPPKPQGFWGNADKAQNLSFVKQAQPKYASSDSDKWEVKNFADNIADVNQIHEPQSPILPLNTDHFNKDEFNKDADNVENFQEQEALSYTQEEDKFEATAKAVLPVGLEYLGQIAKTYLLLKQKNEALILLDQHAIHERILYEKISKGAIQSQQLLIPLDLPLNPGEVKILENNLANLQKLGFGLKILPHSCQIHSVPNQLARQNAKVFVQEILAEKNMDLENIWIKLACSKSIKANTELGTEDAVKLICQWLETAEPDFCPHGRPCVLHFDANSLELMFKRKN